MGERSELTYQIIIFSVGKPNSMAVLIIEMWLLGLARRPIKDLIELHFKDPHDRRPRESRNTAPPNLSIQPILESPMMIGGDQQNEQPEGALVLGEHYQPPALVK